VAGAGIALLCLLWGSTWVVIRGGLDDLPPFTSAALRFAVAGAVMALVTPLLRAREGGTRPPPWLWLFLGAGNFALSYGIVYVTELHLPSGLVSVLWGVFPMLMAILGHFWLPGERLRAIQCWGFLLGFAGLIVLLALDVPSFGPRAVVAALVLLISPLVSAVGTALVKRHGAGTSSVLLNRNAMLLGALLLGVSALTMERDAPRNWTPQALFSVVYLAVPGTVLTFGLYFWLLRTTDANRMSLIAYVTPVIAVLLGSLVRGESVTATMLAGATLVLLGVVIVVRGKRA
jgi:drug/metabolite transporter (DMT)-like permease